MLEKYGYRRIYCVSPKLHLGNPKKNVEETFKLIESFKDAYIVLFPELSLTGYSCEDLFFDNSLHDKLNKSVLDLLDRSKKQNAYIVVGLPFKLKGKLYNCALVVKEGKILGIVPKSFLPNYNEFYENRWFSHGQNTLEQIEAFGQSFNFGTEQIFVDQSNDTSFGVEICEDLWAIQSPSQKLAINGAEIILNLSASNDVVKKHDYRKELVKTQSAKLNAIYCYAGTGSMESSRDVFFSGACMIAENGTMLVEKRNFEFDSHWVHADVDIQKIKNERTRNKTFGQEIASKLDYVTIKDNKYTLNELDREYKSNPFVPDSDDVFKEILDIQSSALARRLIAIKSSKLVLGLSGGSDSTLALIVSLEALKKLKKTPDNLHCISMPGFGTSNRTKSQAERLAQFSKCSFKEISIVPATTQHLKDIDHTGIDVVYENAQARERTQILFDYSNKVGGLVVGTGDLSEIILGFATFNADHMAGYNVNSSIPKSLVKRLINYYKQHNQDLAPVLEEVLQTKISPELLPLDSQGEIAQSSEAILGSYDFHDFFIFHHIKNNFSKDKIKFLAERTFKQDLEKEITTYFTRFFVNQFKRTVCPPGIKVGSVSVSIRGDLRLPDELIYEDS